MSRRSRLHYTLTTIGYGASRMKARLPRSTCLLGDSLWFGAAVRYKLPSHTTSRQNQTPQPQSLGSVRAIAFRSWLPPIGPIKDSHLQSLRHARRNFRLRLRLSLQNTTVLSTPILSLNLVQRRGGSHCLQPRPVSLPLAAGFLLMLVTQLRYVWAALFTLH